MLSERECQQFRPLGQRLLVKRLPLPDQSQGDIYVLGRDYPTLGRVVRTGNAYVRGITDEIRVHDEVQWSIKPDFDQRCVIGPDWLCLETDDINVRIDERGIARATGNRVLLSPLSSDGLLSLKGRIVSNEFQLTRWALGRVVSLGKNSKVCYSDRIFKSDCVVIYNPSLRSELYLNNKQYFVVRDEDCIATVEDCGT